jgi:hypothetical protein
VTPNRYKKIVSLVISVVSKTGFGIFETYTWNFSDISYFLDLRQTRCARKIPNPVLETKLFTKETTYTLDFRKYFVISFWSHSIWGFSVLLEDSLRIISET